jgi:hypothetical protein
MTSGLIVGKVQATLSSAWNGLVVSRSQRLHMRGGVKVSRVTKEQSNLVRGHFVEVPLWTEISAALLTTEDSDSLVYSERDATFALIDSVNTILRIRSPLHTAHYRVVQAVSVFEDHRISG